MKVNNARNKYYLISVDRNIFGQEFFLKNRKGNGALKDIYGRNAITKSISEAQAYCKLGNAENMAKKIRGEVGNTPKIQIHSWSPKNKLGLTTLVKSVE